MNRARICAPSNFSSYERGSSRGWRSTPRDLSVADCVTQAKVQSRSGVDAFRFAQAVPASALDHASTRDRRALLNWVTELATVRSVAVCAARDDTHQH